MLLTGEVPDEETKKQAGVTALGIENVRNVQNELVIGPVASGSQQATDAYITSKVKATSSPRTSSTPTTSRS